MPNPGIGDPYWFEWYVGLKYIIEMLNPDSGISCVIFQHETYQTIDDVVVEYDNGTSQLCYQVKHEIATSQPDNLTFGKLLEKGENGKCLFEALFLGWKKASSGERTTIKGPQLNQFYIQIERFWTGEQGVHITGSSTVHIRLISFSP